MENLNAAMRYAKAFFPIAKDSKNLDGILEDLEHVCDLMTTSSDFKMLLYSPIISNSKKEKIFEEIFKNKISELTFDFILLLIVKGREKLLKEIYQCFKILYNEEVGLVPFIVYTAKDLTNDAKAKINEFVANHTKLKPLPEYIIDKSVIGGMKIKIDDWVYDATIHNQLKKLKETLIYG